MQGDVVGLEKVVFALRAAAPKPGGAEEALRSQQPVGKGVLRGAQPVSDSAFPALISVWSRARCRVFQNHRLRVSVAGRKGE